MLVIERVPKESVSVDNVGQFNYIIAVTKHGKLSGKHCYIVSRGEKLSMEQENVRYGLMNVMHALSGNSFGVCAHVSTISKSIDDYVESLMDEFQFHVFRSFKETTDFINSIINKS